jgi:putative nucleotidyltransferase with HDIG domain
MRTETTAPLMEARDEAAAFAAHCCRVAAAAVEVTKRLGWTSERQRRVQEAVRAHRHDLQAGGPTLVESLVSGVWGYSQTHATRRTESGDETGQLLEMCCFFVQRWEFAPYEMAAFADIVSELRTMALDGFFIARHVECLSAVPLVSLGQVKEVVTKLPVFPTVAHKALQLARNPNAGAGHVEALVGSDPVLAGEVLRAANSPLYAPAMPIRSIRQAVVHMGLGECCRVLAAAAFRPLFNSPLVRPLWNHSLEVAKLAEALARTTGKTDPEEAFLAGLMHDIGRLALWKLPAKLTADYSALVDQGCEPMFAESLLASFDHGVAGREVMRRWNLPSHMVQAVELHHQPERCDTILTQVLYLAEHCSGSQEDMPSMARFKLAIDRSGLDQVQLNALSGTRSPFVEW